MVKELIRNAGLLVILAGVVILAITVYQGSQTNASLSLSLVLIVAGLLGHIIINKVTS